MSFVAYVQPGRRKVEEMMRREQATIEQGLKENTGVKQKKSIYVQQICCYYLSLFSFDHHKYDLPFRQEATFCKVCGFNLCLNNKEIIHFLTLYF